MKTGLFLLSLLIGYASVNAQPTTVEKITALNKAMEDQFNSNDMLKVSANYLDSGSIIGGGQNITGRKDIDGYWTSLKDQSATWKLEIDKIEDYGSIVLQRGRSYLSFSSGGKSNVRFLLVWKKVGDGYRVLYDMFTRL